MRKNRLRPGNEHPFAKSVCSQDRKRSDIKPEKDQSRGSEPPYPRLRSVIPQDPKSLMPPGRGQRAVWVIPLSRCWRVRRRHDWRNDLIGREDVPLFSLSPKRTQHKHLTTTPQNEKRKIRRPSNLPTRSEKRKIYRSSPQNRSIPAK